MMAPSEDSRPSSAVLPALGQRVYLVGFMGAGKTTVGARLSRQLGCPFQDLDRQIESQEGLSIADLFERRGEAAFRQLEHRALRATERLERGLFATGGGILGSEQNRSLIRRLGRSIWLDPSFETISARIDEGNRRLRPLFQDEAGAKELYVSRRAHYGSADEHLVIGPTETSSEVAARIIDLIRTWPA